MPEQTKLGYLIVTYYYELPKMVAIIAPPSHTRTQTRLIFRHIMPHPVHLWLP